MSIPNVVTQLTQALTPARTLARGVQFSDALRAKIAGKLEEHLAHESPGISQGAMRVFAQLEATNVQIDRLSTEKEILERLQALEEAQKATPLLGASTTSGSK